MNRSRIRLISILGLLAALAAGAYFYRQHLEYVAMHTIPPGLRAFNVSDPPPVCGRWKDRMPTRRDPETYRLYIEARKLWRSKIEWQLTREEALRILHDVNLASEKGDWGARALMSYFYLQGLGPLDSNHVLDEMPEKAVEIIHMAVAAGQAWGYYDLGVAYEHGYGGVHYDKDIAWAYYLKAAELGSPDAQMALAHAYEEADRRDAAKIMKMCAFKQGHGPAAYELGLTAQVYKKFGEVMELYQEGTKFGSSECAWGLSALFDREYWSRFDKEELEVLRKLEIQPDRERSKRYREISSALDVNPDLKFPRLGTVLPLPPAELPEWNGIKDALEPETNDPPTY